MSDWLPIETAPRDGTDVVLWMACGSGGWAEVGHWFVTKNDAWWVAHTVERHPTRWSPIPEPPR